MIPIILLLVPIILFSQTARQESIVMVIAHENFRDEELLIPKKIFTEEGYKVVIASTDTTPAKGMLGARVKPGIAISDISDSLFSAIVLVGGSGSKTLFSDTALHRIVQDFNRQKKPVAAICLAPVILGKSGIIKGRKATVWAGAKEELIHLDVDYQSEDVVVDSNIITGCGPKVAETFARKILEILK